MSHLQSHSLQYLFWKLEVKPLPHTNFILYHDFRDTFNELVFNRIQEDVLEMSSLFVEVSRYIHFVLRKRWSTGNFEAVNFLDYYYHLMVKKKAKYEMDAEYKLLRQPLLQRFYDSSYRSNLFVENANKYLTLFHNNIWMHAYNSLRRYFKFEPNKAAVYNTLGFLFEKNSKKIPDQGLLQRMRNDLQWNGEKLDHVQNVKKFWDSIQLFYNLQRYNEEHNLRNFSLIPQLKFGRHHVRYDRFAFYYMLCGLKLYKGPFSTFSREEFYTYFKLPKLTLSRRVFSSLQTDGVSVSLCMDKYTSVTNNNNIAKKRKIKDKENDCCSNDSTLLAIRSKTYMHKIGLDPGCRLIFGGTVDGRPVKISNKYYQNLCGYFSRKSQLERYTNGFTDIDDPPSPNSFDFVAYIKYQLEIFSTKQSIYAQRKVARLQLKKYICTQKARNSIAKIIVPKRTEPTLVCVGSTEIAGNSPIRGYIRTPNKKLLDALRQRKADILLVNEFRTTKLCSQCYSECITSRSPHRYQFCPNCRCCWNRDVNAGINILYLGEQMIQQKDKHVNFDF